MTTPALFWSQRSLVCAVSRPTAPVPSTHRALIVYVAYLAIVIAAFLGLRSALRAHKAPQPAVES